MPNYQLSKIYQLICNTTGKRYIGATCQRYLCTRLAHHVSKNNKTSSREIIEGKNYEMVLIESYPCNSKDELHQRERYYIKTLDCVNKYIPCRTQKEYREDKKQQIKEYQKDYRQQKRDKKNKQTPEEHRAERREYWQSKKESQKVSLSPTE